MKEAGPKPGPVSYCTLIYAFSIRHMVEEAEELVVEISRLMSIPKLCETGLLIMAEEVYKEMVDPTSNRVSLFMES